MALDARYILLPSLEALFRDKDTARPLASGYILFFSDNQRSVGKEVFQLTGSPPNYTYAAYGSLTLENAWRVDLSLVGDLQAALYFYPYDADGNVDNYFIQVYSAGDVLQFSREAWPNLPGGGDGNLVDTNFVANPQFSINNVNPATDSTQLGQIVDDVTQIAPGGWSYERSTGSTAVDVITFPSLGYVTNYPANPKFYFNFQCITPDSNDTYKDVRLKFINVNKFASTTQEYTFSITGAVNVGTALSLPVYLIKNFGTNNAGGPTPTPQSETLIGTFSLTNVTSNQYFSFIFGANTGTTIGSDNNDFIQLAIRIPAGQNANFQFTDALLTPEAVAAPILPDLPDDIYFANSLAGYMPRPAQDGSDYYLPIVNTPSGYQVDTSTIGQLLMTVSGITPASYLPLDGAQYKTDAKSSEGIPYSRLQAVLYAATSANIPIWGTGEDFVTEVVFTTAALNNITHFTNKPGVAPTPANGTTSPGFVFTQLNGTPNSSIEATGLYAGSNLMLLQNITQGIASSFNQTHVVSAYDGNTGFTITVIAYGYYVRQQVEVNCLAGNAITGGHYWVYYTPSSSFYVWYLVNGAGSDPSPAGIAHGIQVDILSTYSAADVARMTAIAINGFDVTAIQTPAAAAIPQSSYWTFATISPAQNYYVWYNKAGGGTDPAIANSIGIEVALTGSETNGEVASATFQEVNSTYFAVGPMYGAFPRALDPTGMFDPDVTRRFMFNGLAGGPLVGSYQLDGNQSHGHNFYATGGGGVSANIIVADATPGSTNVSGDVYTNANSIGQIMEGLREARPYNMSVNFFIKY